MVRCSVASCPTALCEMAKGTAQSLALLACSTSALKSGSSTLATRTATLRRAPAGCNRGDLVAVHWAAFVLPKLSPAPRCICNMLMWTVTRQWPPTPGPSACADGNSFQYTELAQTCRLTKHEQHLCSACIEQWCTQEGLTVVAGESISLTGVSRDVGEAISCACLAVDAGCTTPHPPEALCSRLAWVTRVLGG
jgi:hypothetical protein